MNYFKAFYANNNNDNPEAFSCAVIKAKNPEIAYEDFKKNHPDSILHDLLIMGDYPENESSCL
jgi:hypothetical protein